MIMATSNLTKKGSILAIADYVSITVDKSNNDMGKKDSIFSIAKKADGEIMEFEIENDRIVIQLPESDFDNLQKLQMSKNYVEVVFSLLIVPALIFVLESIVRSDNDEQYREYQWFRSLEKIFKANDLDLTPQTIKTKNSYTLAQKLIGGPISKALIALNERSDSDEGLYIYA